MAPLYRSSTEFGPDLLRSLAMTFRAYDRVKFAVGRQDFSWGCSPSLARRLAIHPEIWFVTLWLRRLITHRCTGDCDISFVGQVIWYKIRS